MARRPLGTVGGSDLLELLTQLMKFVRERGYVYGRLGIIVDNRKIVKVPGKPFYNYVRVIKASGTSQSICLNMTVAPEYNAYVKMEENEEGVLTVVNAISSESIEATGDSNQNISIAPHTHRRGTSLYDRVEGIRFEPGGGEINTDLGPFFVSIAPLHHNKNYFPGQDVNLESYKPVNSNEKRWVKLGIDKDTNQVVIALGPNVGLGAVMSEKSLWGIELPGDDVLPSMGIVLRGDDVVLSENTKIVDCRYWAGANGIGGEGGGEDPGGGGDITNGPSKAAKLTGGEATIGEFDISDSYFLFDGFSEDLDTFDAIDVGTNDDRINIVEGEGGNYLIGFWVEMEKVGTNFPFTIRVGLFLDNNSTPFYYKDFYTDWAVSSQSSFAMDGSTLVNIPDVSETNHYIRLGVAKYNAESIALNFTGQLWVSKLETAVEGS